MGRLARRFFAGAQPCSVHGLGEVKSQSKALSVFWAILFTSDCTGKPAYLEPNSQSMQKTYRGEVPIGTFHNQKHVEKPQTKPQPASTKTHTTTHQLSKTKPINLI
jgi:hypothetical protein